MRPIHRGLAVGTAGIIAVALAVPATADTTTTELDADLNGDVTISEPGHYIDTDGDTFRTISLETDGVTLDGLTFDGAGNTAAAVRNALPGLSDIAVLDSTFTGYTGRTIAIGFAEGTRQAGDRGANLTIAGNTLDDMAGNAATSIAVFNTDGVTITGNVISNADPAFSGRRGINLDGNSAVEVSNNTVSLGASGKLGGASFPADFPVFVAAPWAIQVGVSDASAVDYSIVNNSLSGSYDGVVVLSQRDVTGLKVTGNEIAAGFGVRVNAGGTPVDPPTTYSAIEVSGNRFDATTFDPTDASSYGVRLQADNAVYRDVRITGNRSLGTTDTVLVGPNATVDNVLVRGNR